MKGASHSARSCSGQTPLHLAAASGHLGTARVLLQHLASPNPQDFHKWTPLHWAIFGGWGDVAELLLDNGADVEGGEGVGTSPLQFEPNHNYNLRKTNQFGLKKLEYC
uniref:Uncharacterized protein n=1 Tax=Sinocyclocheilus grahami TaxID=75366 RepID=A0A672K6C9_SINGR